MRTLVTVWWTCPSWTLKVGAKIKIVFDGVEYDGAEVLESLGARVGRCAYRVRAKKLMLTATELRHVLLIDLVDAFVGERAVCRLMIAPRSAHRAHCCLGRKSASTATAEATAAQEAASGSRSHERLKKPRPSPRNSEPQLASLCRGRKTTTQVVPPAPHATPMDLEQSYAALFIC